MPKLTPEDHKARKDATRQIYVDKNGKPISEATKSVAVQDKRDACDVNRIAKRVIDANGQIQVGALSGLVREGVYGDFTSSVDFQETANRVIRMNEEFMRLDPQVRLKFDNDPAKLIDFLHAANADDAKYDEAVALGLVKKPHFVTAKVETPEGAFWVTTKNGKEIRRESIKPSAAKTPAA